MGDSFDFKGDAKGNFGGSGNTYNENRQNNGISVNIKGSTIGGDVKVHDNVVQHQHKDVNVDALQEDLEVLRALLKQKITSDNDDDMVYEAMQTVRHVQKSLTEGDQQKAVAMLQDNQQQLEPFSNEADTKELAKTFRV